MNLPDEFKTPSEETTSLPGMDKAVEALQSLFQGIAQAAQSAFGTEYFRNLQAASWLGQVADCLHRLTATMKAGQPMPAATRGEMTFFREQLTGELIGSKFAPDLFLARLDAAMQTADVSVIDEAAGYFRAASDSVAPPQEQPPQTKL